MADPLLLGVADGEISDSDSSICSWSTNKFGGKPNWMHGPPHNHPACTVCGRLLLLVSQVYCPLHDSQYHRVLYIFGCTNPACWNNCKSWIILRAQTLDCSSTQTTLKDKSLLQASTDFDIEDWCDDAGDWGESEDIEDSMMSELQSATGKMTIEHSHPSSIPNDNSANDAKMPLSPANNSHRANIPHFCPYYINVFEDNTSVGPCKTGLSEHEKELISQYQEVEGVDLKDWLKGQVFQMPGRQSKGQTVEEYERTDVAHGDQSFHKFQKHIQSCPQQCLRYQYSGNPLSIAGTKPSNITATVPVCQYCGAKRVFELQLMPALVRLLKGSDYSLVEDSENTARTTNMKQSGRDGISHVVADTREEASKISVVSNTGINHCKVTTESGYEAKNAAGNYANTNEARGIVNNEQIKNQEYHNLLPTEEATNIASLNFVCDMNQDLDEVTKDSAASESITAEDLNIDTVEIEELRVKLERAEYMGIEFGTVIVYSCSKSCWNEDGKMGKYREEVAVIESDPDAKLFTR